jgi:hypothetical protein
MLKLQRSETGNPLAGLSGAERMRRNDLMTPKANDDAARVGAYTLISRFLCSVLVACPVFYVSFVTEGSAAQFLILVLLAPVAGLVLVANSLFCLVRYRKVESFWIGLAFVLVGVTGFLEALYFLPKFRM